MTNQTNKLIKLCAIACFSILSVTDLCAQVIGGDELNKDIPVMTDIVTIKQITQVTLEFDNNLGDIIDDEMNQIFQVWQNSFGGQVQRTDEPSDETSDINILEPDTEESEGLSNSLYERAYTNEEVSLLESLTDDEIEFLAYPNPAKDILNIKFEDDGYFEISLFNIVGSLEVYYQSFEQQSHILDISNLNVGMYLLQISDGSDVKTKRVNIVR